MNKAPFKADIVGSFLRPERLKKARDEYSENKISKDQLREIENEEIIKLIDAQRENGLLAVTDGEFRRRWWHLDFIEQLNGVEKYSLGDGLLFNVEAKNIESYYIKDRLSFPKNHSFLDDFKFMSEHSGELLVKQTIPGPNMLYNASLLGENNKLYNPYYGKLDELEDDIAKTYQDIMEAFYNIGCRYLQLDDTAWGALIDPKFKANLEEGGYDYKELIQRFGDLTEKAIKNKPEDMVITTHICRGNFQSSWLYEGDYDSIAKRLFELENMDGFFLEYDTERAGDFDSLKYLKNQKIALGLVSSKVVELEDVDFLLGRIKEAMKYVPVEQICISPQCGFASTVEGNLITEEVQWAKIRLCVEVAEKMQNL